MIALDLLLLTTPDSRHTRGGPLTRPQLSRRLQGPTVQFTSDTDSLELQGVSVAPRPPGEAQAREAAPCRGSGGVRPLDYSHFSPTCLRSWGCP